MVTTREVNTATPEVMPPPATMPYQGLPTAPVQTRGNGMAVASFVLGLVGALFGLIPILAMFALLLGVLGLTFGLVGHRAAVNDPLRGGKGMALAGVILGSLAIGLAILGFVIVANAFSS